jgi:hypothetical protein
MVNTRKMLRSAFYLSIMSKLPPWLIPETRFRFRVRSYRAKWVVRENAVLDGPASARAKSTINRAKRRDHRAGLKPGDQS